MNAKTWIIFAVVAVGLLGGLIFMSNQNKLDVSNVDTNAILQGSEQSGGIGDNTLGNTSSSVILIEYGDYQCPGCASANPRVKSVVEKYEGQIVFVYRHLPLTSIHPHARAAAATAEAAGKQGQYWDMHDLLFTNQNSWSGASSTERVDIFRGYAEQLGLDLERFDTDLASEAINSKVSFDNALARAVGATSTPSFFLNGEALDAASTGTEEALDEVIRAKIIEAGIDLPDDEDA